jgi:hypothetical protein
MSAREGEGGVVREHAGGVHAPARSALGVVVEHRPMWGARQGDGSVDVYIVIIDVSIDTTLGEDWGRKLAR